jgi:hypothetical protein
VDEDRHAGGQELRTGGGDGEAAALRQAEGQRDELARAVQIVEIGLLQLIPGTDGRACDVDQAVAVKADEESWHRRRVLIDGAIGAPSMERPNTGAWYSCSTYG